MKMFLPFLLTILLSSYCVGKVLQNRIFIKYFPDVIFITNLQMTTSVKSVIDCGRRCTSLKDCTAYTFTKNAGEEACRLHSKTFYLSGMRGPAPGTESYYVGNEVIPCGQMDPNGWVILQRRINGAVDFNRNFNDYVNGFGVADGECWAGLNMIEDLTVYQGYNLLRVDLVDSAGKAAYVKYNGFYTTEPLDDYRVFVSTLLEGTAGSCLRDFRGRLFSTYDKDLDWDASRNCAAERGGGWWFGECNVTVFLNGPFTDDGVYWGCWPEAVLPLTLVEMKTL